MTPGEITANATSNNIMAWATVLLFLATLLLFLANAVMAYFLRFQAKEIQRGFTLQIHQSRAKFLLQIADQWSAVLPARYAIRSDSATYDVGAMKSKYGSDITKFMAGDEWKKLRSVCNFYESVGMLAWYHVLELKHILALVTVDDDLYWQVQPIIGWLREAYRQDIYLFWDWLEKETDPANDNREKAADPLNDARPENFGELTSPWVL